MASLALSFNNVDLTAINNNDGQIWVTSSELARALGYKRSDAVSRIYSRNADEFSDDMTALVSSPRNVNLTVRIFSLRGCHLAAMFASTEIAKQFRKWVLDVLASNSIQGYRLGDLQDLRDAASARYALGFSVASGGGKVLSEWRNEKQALDAEIAVLDNLMQPLLTGLIENQAPLDADLDKTLSESIVDLF